MLCCTDSLCHIGVMNYGHCGSLTGFQGLAALNLISLKTIIENFFMCHGTCNKSKTKLYFFSILLDC